MLHLVKGKKTNMTNAE